MSRISRAHSRGIAIVIALAIHVTVVLLARSEWFRAERRRTPGEERYTFAYLIPAMPREKGDAPAIPVEFARSVSPPQVSLPESWLLSDQPPPSSTAPIDWNAQVAQSARTIVDEDRRARERGTDFTPWPKKAELPRLFADDELGKDVPWSFRTRRIERSANGMFIVWISERCFLVAGIFPLCRIGKLAETDTSELFKRMQRPKALPQGAKLDTIVSVTQQRLAELSRLLVQWRAEHGAYPRALAEVFALNDATGAADAAPVDPWGNALVFAHPARRTGCDFDLYSLGANGRDERGEDDDIVTRDHCEAALPRP